MVDEERFNLIITITSVYNQFAPVKVSARTVCRTLKSNGINNYVAVSKPYLASKNLHERLIWTKYHDSSGNLLWAKVVFIDV